jgi:hypothetical protein
MNKLKLLFTEYSILHVFLDIITFRLELCSKEKAQQRLKKCLVCEFIEKVPFKRCLICGCFLKIKTRISKSKCPDRIW